MPKTLRAFFPPEFFFILVLPVPTTSISSIRMCFRGCLPKLPLQSGVPAEDGFWCYTGHLDKDTMEGPPGGSPNNGK